MWRSIKPIEKQAISVKFFYEATHERFKLSLVGREVGFEKKITDKSLHRPGLALAGYVSLFTHHRVQVFGNTEIWYLASLSREDRIISYKRLFQFEIPCFVITGNNDIDEDFVTMANDHGTPVFRTIYETTKAIYFLSDFLDDHFAPQATIHGSFVDVYGIGVLFVGHSGIGKSEIALDLVERGHRLVADDVVIVTQKGEGILMGTGTELVKHIIEIRGLGLIDVRQMFGIRSIRYQKRVEVIVELEVWNEKEQYDRTGLESDTVKLLDVDVLHVKLPIFPGKNVTVIAEVIALNYLLKHYGYDTSKEFAKKLEELLAKRGEGNNDSTGRAIQYFEHDFE